MYLLCEKKYKMLIQPNLTFLKTFRNSKLNKIVTSPYKIVKIKCFTLIFVLFFLNKLKKLKKNKKLTLPITLPLSTPLRSSKQVF